MDIKNIKNELNSFGAEVVKNARQNLVAAGKGGGRLEASIDFDVKTTADGFTVQFFMADYGTFVDKGVKGAGGTIKTGKNAGSWGGRRHYVTWEGKRKDSPYKFGTGTGKKGGLTKGIGSFIRKKGLQPRSEGGQFMTTKGLRAAIVRTIWIKGIHGISFFQKSLGLGMKKIREELLEAVKADVIEHLAEFKTIK